MLAVMHRNLAIHAVNEGRALRCLMGEAANAERVNLGNEVTTLW
jgi:hypothetical protein